MSDYKQIYKVIKPEGRSTSEKRQKLFNKLGKEGWIYCGIDSYCFDVFRKEEKIDMFE